MSQRIASLNWNHRANKVPNHKIRNVLIALYILIILGISASARADVSIYPISGPISASEINSFTGEVAVTLDGTSYLVVSENEYFEMASAQNIDLTQFNGESVVVKGFQLKHKLGPVLTLNAMDPLDGATVEKRAAPVLIVFGISAVAP